MPETRERDPRYNFIDFVEMFFVPIWDESPREGQITIIEVHERAKNNVKSNKRTSRRCRI